MPSTFSSDGGRATLSVNVDADADDDAMERELLEDIVPWSPWKAAVVALKRKQHDRSELSECTTDLIVDESPFSFIFQLRCFHYDIRIRVVNKSSCERFVLS
eukprot:SAG31_NODE_51_length_30464_cov_16.835628_25_plen_102_part_00